MLTKLEDFSGAELTVSHLKNQLDLLLAEQGADFLANQRNIESLLYQRSNYMDALLSKLWYHFELDKDIALLAVGGYGRRELHPLSDIDLLILSKQTLQQKTHQKISSFITLLWDLKLVIGHSVRTLEECIDIGALDLTVGTSLQEARFIVGDKNLEHALKERIFSPNFWPSVHFFHAKIKEQNSRHAKYNNTAYNLEPDIKSCPGGLRDIHTLSWIARRHFSATSLQEMNSYGFLTQAEFQELEECQHFLWIVRFALHLLLKRSDDRLTFSHQQEVAEMLGFKGKNNQAIERMMKSFYRTLGRVIELNQMLIRLFAREIELEKLTENQSVIQISDDFQRHGKEIDAKKSTLFQSRPDSILDMFLYIANNSDIESITASTLRQLRNARRGMSSPISSIATARTKFIALIRHPNALKKAIPLMHKHGIFSAYLPQWNQIVGQMQFDLFHVYTVDEHTIRLLKHFNLFSDEHNKDRHPICCEIFPHLAKPELLILAAIFHDIAKGRGSDHSKLGASEAYQFCKQHHLSDTESSLVSWLVEKHLLMSVTAQRRDIYDTAVLQEFALTVQNEERLNYLICLTVADICATNPNLWNSWKRTLLAELYHAALNLLRRGDTESFSHVRDRIRNNKQLAKSKLLSEGLAESQIHSVWQRFRADYFLRHNADQIAWHTKQISRHDGSRPLVIMTDKNTKESTEIFIYAKDKPSLFSRVVDTLDRKNLSVHDAQIMTSKDGFALDTFIVLDTNHQIITQDRYQNIINSVIYALAQKEEWKAVNRRAPKKLMAFNIEPQVNFLPTQSHSKTLIELVALDTPGLLSKIAAVFAKQNISLQAAKITTIGERAEDFFIISNRDNRALDKEAKSALKKSLINVLIS